ncbi:MAG: DNA mismatch repair protein MutS [Roseburia sp.]|nr:DNA mismatch repair protein MutS [Roseburia sp.]
MGKGGGLSDMMKHYLQVKDGYKDCVVFYRLGDFYEMFFDDAVKVSQLLGLTLTGRDCGLENRAPMCGVPFHAADGYISQLVSLGEKVAICEQVQDPSEAKGLVKREVVRVVTAGTVTSEDSLDERQNNYICSVYKKGDAVAVGWADITTGELCATKFSGAQSVKLALNQLMKLAVKEIISNDEMLFAVKDIPEVSRGILPPFSSYPEWAYNFAAANNSLLTQLNTTSLSAFSVDGQTEAICAVGALIEYLKETQKHALSNIDNIKYLSVASSMQLDMTAIRNLEIIKNLGENKKYGSLLWVLDKTCTGMGARLLNNVILSPLVSADRINYRLDGVEELNGATVVRVGITELLRQIKDIERLAGKISNNEITPVDCLALAQSLLVIPSIRFRLSGFNSRVLRDISEGLVDMTDTADAINATIDPDVTLKKFKEGGYIKRGYDARLDELRDIKSNAAKYVIEMESRERDATGIRTLKIGYNRVFGYYIEVSKSFKDAVPNHYHRRQTLANAERYYTDELKGLEEKILSCEEGALKLETQIYRELKAKLSEKINCFKSISESVARLDVLTSFAEVSKRNNYVRPKIADSGEAMIIKEGRHPVVELLTKEKFVANDILIDEADNRTLIITGPNMAGKSTYMRQNAIIAIMAHIGCFVPAKSAQIPVIDRVFTRVGASDNLILNQSTFMVEMIEVAAILQNATKNSLLILDEVGRGTSTFDGLSIAWAVIEHITEKIGAKTLFATHYHELLQLEDRLSGVKNYKIAVKDFNGTVVFLRKIMRGGANRSFGIEVASLAGVPACVTDRAKIILKAVENGELASEQGKFEQSESREIRQSEAEKILSELDLNNLSPMQAFMILSDLVEKVK